jgi:catechol 2,3-dioxygenase-like lactoylglutathione lyase family enzyme
VLLGERDMIQAVGDISVEYQELVKKAFLKHEINIEFTGIDRLAEIRTISFDKKSSKILSQSSFKFYNWDLLFSILGPNDTSDDIELKLEERIKILKSVMGLKSRPVGEEFHGSIRVHDLAKSSCFYTWLFGVEPKEWTHRYVTFVRPDTKFNFVLLVSDGKELHKDTLYHLGMGVSTKDRVIEFYHSAVENGFHIEKPPRTTWRGTPLHELWLKDPDGTLIEIYARLTDEKLKEMPKDKEPIFLV